MARPAKKRAIWHKKGAYAAIRITTKPRREWRADKSPAQSVVPETRRRGAGDAAGESQHMTPFYAKIIDISQGMSARGRKMTPVLGNAASQVEDTNTNVLQLAICPPHLRPASAARAWGASKSVVSL